MDYSKTGLAVSLLLASSLVMADCNTQGSATSAAQHEQMKEFGLSEIIKTSSPDQRASMLTNFMSSVLALNEKQKADIGAINLEYAGRLNVLMESTKPDVDKKAEFDRLNSEREAKIASLLTDAQMQAYKQTAKEVIDTYKVM